jgi:hypothetical protein
VYGARGVGSKTDVVGVLVQGIGSRKKEQEVARSEAEQVGMG